MARTIQQQIARQRRVVENTPRSPLLAYHAAREKLDSLLAEQPALEQPFEMSAAQKLNENQRRYDILHHRMRVRDLTAMGRLTWLEKTLLRQSQDYLRNPVMSCRAVDLSNGQYLAELDAFAAHP